MKSKLSKQIKKIRLRLKLLFRRKRSDEEKLHAIRDSLELQDAESVLFIDLGANLGQGYTWFSRYFDTPNVEFELFEPNPNCFAELLKLPGVRSGEVKVHNVGVGAAAGFFKFYGLAEGEGGKTSQGGSIVKEHNSNRYAASDDGAIDVEVINFSDYLREKAKNFKKIVVKMDIEGAEVDLLESMIENRSVDLIDYLYVEFHSQYQDEETAAVTRAREEAILTKLKKGSCTRVRVWH
jgi:FkbM family methyltransferase